MKQASLIYPGSPSKVKLSLTSHALRHPSHSTSGYVMTCGRYGNGCRGYHCRGYRFCDPPPGAGRGRAFHGSERVTEGRGLSTSLVSHLPSCCHSELNAVHCYHRNRGVLVGLINFELKNFVSLFLFLPPSPPPPFLSPSLSLSLQDGRFNPFTLNPGQSHELYYLDTAKPPKLVVTVSYFGQIDPIPRLHPFN